jgi:flagellar motor switch protein FliM
MSLISNNKAEFDAAALGPRAARVATSLQAILAGRCGDNLLVHAGDVQQARYSEWRIAQNPFGMLLRYKIPGEATEIVAHLPGPLVNQIVDLHYGGNGQLPPRSAFTPAELQFAERLGLRIGLSFAPLSGGKGAQGLELAEIQTDLMAFAWPNDSDELCIMPFFVEPKGLKATTIAIWMATEAASELLKDTEGGRNASVVADPVWQQKLAMSAMQIRLPARAVLARCDLPAHRLLTLAAGDIIPLLLPTTAPLTIAGRVFASGSIGESGGRAALKIEKMEGPAS